MQGKAGKSTLKDVNESYIDFLLDLNTEHAFQLNRVLYLAFVTSDKGKSHLLFNAKQTIAMDIANKRMVVHCC